MSVTETSSWQSSVMKTRPTNRDLPPSSTWPRPALRWLFDNGSAGRDSGFAPVRQASGVPGDQCLERLRLLGRHPGAWQLLDGQHQARRQVIKRATDDDVGNLEVLAERFEVALFERDCGEVIPIGYQKSRMDF